MIEINPPSPPKKKHGICLKDLSGPTILQRWASQLQTHKKAKVLKLLSTNKKKNKIIFNRDFALKILRYNRSYLKFTKFQNYASKQNIK